jgi:hypothetical protein
MEAQRPSPRPSSFSLSMIALRYAYPDAVKIFEEFLNRNKTKSQDLSYDSKCKRRKNAGGSYSRSRLMPELQKETSFNLIKDIIWKNKGGEQFNYSGVGVG